MPDSKEALIDFLLDIVVCDLLPFLGVVTAVILLLVLIILSGGVR